MLIKEFVEQVQMDFNKEVTKKEDPAKTLSNLKYFESQLVVGRLKNLLMSYSERNEEISENFLEIFRQFLRNRYEATYPSYNENTSANYVCKRLAYYLAKASDPQKDENKILMPYKLTISPSPEVAKIRLGNAIMYDLENRLQFFDNLLCLDKKDWKAYCNLFSDKTLFKVLNNNNKKIDEFIENENLYTKSETYNKAVLFCKYELYRRRRNMKGRRTWYGEFGNIFIPVPDKKQKLDAVDAAQMELISDNSLEQFHDNLNDPDTGLNVHKTALTKGKLSKITFQIPNAAAENFTKPKIMRTSLKLGGDS